MIRVGFQSPELSATAPTAEIVFGGLSVGMDQADSHVPPGDLDVTVVRSPFLTGCMWGSLFSLPLWLLIGAGFWYF